MKFSETKLRGVFKIDIEPKFDGRGFFARSWCHNEFESHGLNPSMVQCSISFNTGKGTLRGMHLQMRPYAETKLIRCTRGAIYDVVLDLRPDSPTFKEWIAATLTADNRMMLFVPEGCAHGFLSLERETEVLYQMSEFFHAGAARSVRWNDPAFGIVWPGEPEIMSENDRILPDFDSAKWTY
jgi:dTDP-4-dehydrorhamnose 3,5-epimerase